MIRCNEGDLVAYRCSFVAGKAKCWRMTTVESVLSGGRVKTEDGFFWRKDGSWLKRDGAFHSVGRLQPLNSAMAFPIRCALVEQALSKEDWRFLSSEDLEIIGRFLLLRFDGDREHFLRLLNGLLKGKL